MNNFDEKAFNEVELNSNYKRLSVGPQHCIIRKVDVDEEKQYVKLYFDIASGELKNYFQEKEARYTDWSNQGIMYRSYKDSAMIYFKSFIVALEKSNKDYSFIKTNYDFKTFLNKEMVVVFGEVEIPYLDDENKIKTVIKPIEIRSLEALRSGNIKTPSIKKLNDKEKEMLFKKEEPIVLENLPF
jgi:hypothetical protein